MLLEVIATCIDDARQAEENGADRLELITAVTEGGLTPGIGLVRQVVRSVRIPVHVMVRPHSRSFVYDGRDLETVTEEIRAIADAGAAGIVFGAITADGRIDERALEAVLPLAAGMQVTFHRAFDELDDLPAGLRTLLGYPGVTRILTSGGMNPAPEAIPAIRGLVEASKSSSLRILAGNGLKPEGIESFIERTGVTEVHFGSAVRLGRSGLAPIDPERLRALSDCLHRYGKS
ncbi:copper homeostasis protein CutC [Paenibacillus flagellatus]|uniref:PF03932 family protein CutC n=1 Tax=Paenibacillus flagellatus TaxID=2211139 RepID=A0A2V5K8V0_9BACL|nr:copper homeostasis protein CutC [Paenibacillus flagellatus]PYI55965.1 copper homeostasis protein [Paenibacillus flagellatus]